MNLLVVTQVVDTTDPILGFFHHWLEEFAKHFDHIEVICLREGTHALPENVRVHSLGKEKGRQHPVAYALRFLVLIWKLRHTYDRVFVHMNAEYVVLGGWLWKIMQKRIALWYNHTVGSLSLRLASVFADRLFHTSPYAYPARYKTAKQMPAGVDTDLFCASGQARSNASVYYQGRIAPAKRVHLLLAAVVALREQGTSATVTLVGPEEPAYGARLRSEFKEFFDSGVISFLGPKRNEDTPVLYSSHAVAVNLTDDGNFDKTVLEALACETPVVVASKAFAQLAGVRSVPAAKEDPEVLKRELRAILMLPEEERSALGHVGRESVIHLHSLPALAKSLAQSMEAL